MRNQSFSDRLLKLKNRFNKFNLHEKVFLVYLWILIIFLLCFPIINVSSLRWETASKSFYIFWSWEYLWTMLIILISLIVLVWRNLSVKFKNLFSTYFGWKENDSLINFLFLFIIITAFLSIKNTVNIASSATSTISFTWIWVFTLVLILIGIIITLISVFKWAQKNGKKTKIINVVDEEHSQMESTKDEIKKWLFNENEM